jgi:hypothetical protein
MLYLQAKYLEARDLPSQGDFPASTLITVLDGTETLNLVGRTETLAEQVANLKPFADVILELRHRKIDLASFGGNGNGKGKAYRLSVMRLVTDLEEALR